MSTALRDVADNQLLLRGNHHRLRHKLHVAGRRQLSHARRHRSTADFIPFSEGESIVRF